MVSSGRKIIVPLLLLLSAIVSANAQPAADKGPRATISGKVTIAGEGVSGIVVGLAISTPSSSIHVTRFRGVTDEEGNYQIKNLPPDTYQVLVSAPAYVQSERKSVVVGKNEVVENVDITLSRGGVITGKVTDADGRLVVEEQILLSSTTPSRGLPYLRTIRTDDRGVYRAFGLPPGRYIVSAGTDSFSSFRRTGGGLQRTYHPSALNASDATPIEVNEGTEATNVDITLGRELSRYVARGRIINGDTSEPVPNARIGIQLFFSYGSTSDSATESTKDGEFTIENLAPGKYGVYLESQTGSEWFSEAVRFEVLDQDIDGLLIKMSKGGSVSGVVVIEGTHESAAKLSLAGHTIGASLSGENSLRSIPSVNINQDGSFRVIGLPAGHLMLSLPINRDRLRLMRIERGGVVYRSGIELKEREQLTGLRVVVSQANGTIRGVLKLPEGVELPAPARLHVYVRRIEDPAVSIFVEANARGQFLVQDLVAGTYEFNIVVVGVPGEQRPRIPRPAETVMVTNGAIADVTITLQLPKTGP